MTLFVTLSKQITGGPKVNLLEQITFKSNTEGYQLPLIARQCMHICSFWGLSKRTTEHWMWVAYWSGWIQTYRLLWINSMTTVLVWEMP